MEQLYIRQILNGDVAKFSWFIETYKNLAWSVAFRITGNREDAEEVVQDSFLNAWRSLAKFKGEAKFSTWLTRIVVNNAWKRTSVTPISPWRPPTGNDSSTRRSINCKWKTGCC